MLSTTVREALRAAALLGVIAVGASTCSRSALDVPPPPPPEPPCPTSLCSELSANCGTVGEATDRCGADFCGKCTLPDTCGGGGTAHRCGCKPKTCAAVGAECGDALDGCDGVLHCGACPDNQVCGGGGPNRCGPDPCKPQTCAELGASCGKISDGCASVLSCGTCQAPDTCGGGGVAHQCGCTAVGCVEQGAQCGATSDTCGGTLDCGKCTPPNVCGVGGTHHCGCPAASCGSVGANCGHVLDGCGGILQCGTDCSEHSHGKHVSVCVGIGPTVCSEEGQSCLPLTCAKVAAKCGLLNDGCANIIDCGSCKAPATCGGAGVPNQCGCTPKTCDALGAKCGPIADGCGGTLMCGTCPGVKACDPASHTCG